MRIHNPPITGHTLLNEGHMYGNSQGTWESPQTVAVGGCSCGYQPIGWQTMSIAKVRRWHREHKAQIRNGTPAPAVGLLFIAANQRP